jgi:alcohol dehydrogenase
VLLSDILPTGFEIGVLSGRIKHGDDIAIVGSGPVGLAVLLTAQFYSPNRIILIGGSNDNRLKFAQSIGATHVINSSKEENVVEKIKEITDGEGVDVAIEAVGIPQTLQLCTDVIKPGGHVANIGVHGQPVELALERLWIKNITITMGLVNTNTIPDLIKAIESKKINPSKMISHHFTIAQIEKAYDVFINAAKEKALKVIISA